MCKPSYLVVAYFPNYLSIYETYLLQNWLPRWNQILTQLRFIHNCWVIMGIHWVIMGIQWMVRWSVLVHCGQVRWLGEVLVKTQSTFQVLFLIFRGATSQIDWPISPKTKTTEAPRNRRFCFDVHSSSPWACLYRWKENNICQSIWDKGEVLKWRTYWEPIRNLEETPWEHIGKHGKMKKKNPSHPPQTWKE